MRTLSCTLLALATALYACSPSGEPTQRVSRATSGGAPPVLRDASMPDPARNVAEPRRPWFQLPIRFEIQNVAPTAIRVRIVGEFTTDDTSLRWPMSFAHTKVAGTATEFVLAAGETRVHRVVWDTVRDVGFGIPFEGRGMKNAIATLRAERVGTPASSNPVATNASRLFTNPFADFHEELVDPVGLVQGQAAAQSAQTSGLFYTRTPAPGRENMVVGYDQQYAALEIPGLRPGDTDVDLGTDPLDPGDRASQGVVTLHAVDADPGPDVIAEINGDFTRGLRHVMWPQTGQWTELPRRGQPRVRSVRDASGRPIEFSSDEIADPRRLQPVALDVGGRKGSLFLRFSEPFIGDVRGDCLVMFANALWRSGDDPGDPWELRRQQIAAGAPMPVMMQDVVRLMEFWGFPGEFDGDPSTRDYFIGSKGSELTMVGGRRRGFSDILTYRVTDTDVQVTPMNIWLQTPPPADIWMMMAPIHSWIACPLPNPARADKPDVLLVRAVEDRMNPGSQRMTLDVLPQRAAPEGGLQGQSWYRLDALQTGRDRYPGILPDDAQLVSATALDLEGTAFDGGTDDPEIVMTLSSGRKLVVVVRTVPENGLAVWRKLMQVGPTSGYSFQFDRTQLVDANGDDCPDLLVYEAETANPAQGRWLSYPSLLTGVAGSRSAVADSAGSAPSRRPAVFDVDGDGFADVITQGRVHFGTADGGYELAGSLSIGGNQSSRYRVEQIFDPGVERVAQIDVVHWAPRGPAAVETIANTDDRGSMQRSSWRWILTRDANLHALTPFLPPGRIGNGEAKEFAAILDRRGTRQLYRVRPNGFVFLADPDPWITERVDLLAVVRRGPLGESDAPETNVRMQDVVVAESGSNRVVVLQADAQSPDGYRRRSFDVPEPIDALAAGSASDDLYEDLMVLTTDTDGTRRVYRVTAGGTRGVGEPASVTPVLQFTTASGPGAPTLGFAFDQNARLDAQGVLVLGDVVRFMLPRGRMIRSTVPALGSDAELSMIDTDGDGVVEVFGATGGATGSALFRIDRAFRQP